MDWNKYRRPDGTIDLVEAFQACYGGEYLYDEATKYLKYIELLQPIKSRQLAAIAVITVIDISNR